MRIEDRLDDMITFMTRDSSNLTATIELAYGVYSISFECWSSCGNEYWSEGEFETLDELENHILEEHMPSEVFV